MCFLIKRIVCDVPDFQLNNVHNVIQIQNIYIIIRYIAISSLMEFVLWYIVITYLFNINFICKINRI